MARWVKGAEKVVMIDGCFLKCHGRAGQAHRLRQGRAIDALPFYKKYTDVFLMDDVPEQERATRSRDR
jgi:hypothetical protein